MRDDEKPNREPTAMAHQPLPYLVRIRIVAHEDARPETREVAMWAYSVLEACLQATLEAGGSGFDDAKIKVEEVRPDLAEYSRWFIGVAHEQVRSR